MIRPLGCQIDPLERHHLAHDKVVVFIGISGPRLPTISIIGKRCSLGVAVHTDTALFGPGRFLNLWPISGRLALDPPRAALADIGP